jgi:hypothetical protein
MDDKYLNEYKNGLIQEAKRNVSLCNNGNKQKRERAICAAFLRCLGVEFSADEIKSSTSDPPDVIFRSTRFEVMEILDENRRRHTEFKNKVNQYNKAESFADIMEPYHAPTSISYEDLVSLIIQKLDQNKVNEYKKNEIDFAQIDVLVYVNLKDKYPDINKKSLRLSNDFSNSFKRQGWRSVSMIMGVHSHVIYALESAPEFIYSLAGQVRCECPSGKIWDF